MGMELKLAAPASKCARWSCFPRAVSPLARLVVYVIVYEPLVRYLSSATSAHAHLERWDFNDHTKREVGVRELVN